MVFRGFWLVSMVFQVGFMVFHSFWSVSMVFQVGFMVFGWFPCFSRWFHDFWLVSMVLLVENTPQNCILAQRSSLGLAGRRPALA